MLRRKERKRCAAVQRTLWVTGGSEGATRGGEREVVITQELPVKACVVGESLAWETRAKTK